MIRRLLERQPLTHFGERPIIAPIGLGLLMVVGLAGCDGTASVQPFEQVTDPTRLYMRLRLDQPAVNLSATPGFSVLQLTATPLDALGQPMPGMSAPTFRSSDSTKVLVSPEGVVTGLQAVSGVLVIAELAAAGNVRHADTAIVNVHATPEPNPPQLATVTIDPVLPDSAVVPVAVQPSFPVTNWLGMSIVPGGWPAVSDLAARTRALTAAGDILMDLVVEYASLDPGVAVVDRRTGRINPVRPGDVRLVARTWAYGVEKADTAVYTITNPAMQEIRITADPSSVGLGATYPGRSVFGPPVTIRPYGLVFWVNLMGQPLDIVFDDPTSVVEPPTLLCSVVQNPGPGVFFNSPNACGVGNFAIPASSSSNSADYATTRVRQFPVPGSYTYRDTHTGAVGKVIVTE